MDRNCTAPSKVQDSESQRIQHRAIDRAPESNEGHEASLFKPERKPQSITTVLVTVSLLDSARKTLGMKFTLH